MISKFYVLFILLTVFFVLLSMNIILDSPVKAAEPSITITAPTEINSWELSPIGTQPKTTTGALSVVTTDADGLGWTIVATDYDTNTSGFMTKYTGGFYEVGTDLKSALQVSSEGGSVTLPGGGIIVSGIGNTNPQSDYTILFNQIVDWEDQPGTYRITVTFTGTLTP